MKEEGGERGKKERRGKERKEAGRKGGKKERRGKERKERKKEGGKKERRGKEREKKEGGRKNTLSWGRGNFPVGGLLAI
jgi:hypothetical protein